jgi:endonuclease/exonuclease/phosphatase family metal-dependent hydrolase
VLDAECVRVMSFNVRQMDGDDGPNAWEHRKELLVETLQMCRPHLLGTQEIFAEQAAFIQERIPELTSFGRGRFGDSRDKHNLIFFDSDKFSLLECGDRWFSQNPEIPGSADWGIPRPRMVTWGRLLHKQGAQLSILNTHMPYGRGADAARRQSAHVVLQAISRLPGDLPLFLTGDFNASVGGEIYNLLTANLEDAWTTAQRSIGPEGTLHGFGRILSGSTARRIDWILYRNAGAPVQAETVTHAKGKLYPSDHYPVCAEFCLTNGNSLSAHIL